MNYKRYVFQLLACFMSITLLLVGFNYFFDPYGIFRTDFSKQQIQPNQHFIKMNFIINNPQKYDSFIFGSSRVRGIDPETLPDGKYYNMGYPTGLPGEFLKDIKIMLKHGVKINNIVIGLDEFSFREDPETHFDMLRYPYLDPPWMFYAKYLVQLPIASDLLGYVRNFNNQPATTYDFYNTGMIFNTQAETDIEADVERHINAEKFNQPAYYPGNRIEKTLKELEEIKEITQQNNINLILFINPIHKTTYLSTNVSEFNEFKRKLAVVLPYFDFSGINDITKNNYYYYETSHYRPMVSQMIVNQIFYTDKILLPGHFGTYVTQDNVLTHIEMLNKNAQ